MWLATLTRQMRSHASSGASTPPTTMIPALAQNRSIGPKASSVRRTSSVTSASAAAGDDRDLAFELHVRVLSCALAGRSGAPVGHVLGDAVGVLLELGVLGEQGLELLAGRGLLVRQVLGGPQAVVGPVALQH